MPRPSSKTKKKSNRLAPKVSTARAQTANDRATRPIVEDVPSKTDRGGKSDLDNAAAAAKCTLSRSAYLGLREVFLTDNKSQAKSRSTIARTYELDESAKPYVRALSATYPLDQTIKSTNSSTLNGDRLYQLSVYLKSLIESVCAPTTLPAFAEAKVPRKKAESCRIAHQFASDSSLLRQETENESMWTDKSQLVKRFNDLLSAIKAEQIDGLFLQGVSPAEVHYWHADSKKQLLVDIELLSTRISSYMTTCTGSVSPQSQ